MSDPIQVRIRSNPLRVLDFDIECRPLSWIAQDYVSKEVTAIACKFLDEPDMRCWCLGDVDGQEMLERFVEQYDKADLVTGHYIRGFDLPTLNGGLTELGMPPLSDKLTHDTKLDLVKRSGMSNSQKNLAAMLGCEAQKVDMDQDMWRQANRLTPEGIALTRERVMGDVKQHIEMRAKLLQQNMLRPPRMWTSAGPMRAAYTP